MPNFKQEKSGWRRAMESRPVLILLAILVVVFAVSLVGFTRKMRETAKNKEIAEQKVADLEEEKNQLSDQTAKLQTDEGVEESIRDKFGLVRPGEGVIVITDPPDAAPDAGAQKPGGFFSFIKKWFK